MIPKEYRWRYIFHMTDIRNLESIIKYGLLSAHRMEALDIKHENISNLVIQERREKVTVPCGPGGSLHDYVPFYFTSMNPMLLSVINKKNYDQPFILFLCLKIQKLENKKGIFSEASINTNSVPKIYDNCSELTKLDWDLIDSRKWHYNDEDRHRKMAEALIKDEVKISDIDAIVVYNENIKKCVEFIFKRNKLSCPRICFSFGLDDRKSYCFFYTKFFLKDPKVKNNTLVTGPVFLLHEYKALLKNIKEMRMNRKKYLFPSLDCFIKSADDNFNCIPELKGIYGLKTENPIHKETVSEHTINVVKNIRSHYNLFSDKDKRILVAAAYLHDIGKGPKDKWKDGKQLNYPDHPADAIPMLEKILTEDIDNLTDDDIRKICMLVVYHDLVGDCICKERDINQIINVAHSENDLDLLITISLADTQSINSTWYTEIYYSKENFRKKLIGSLK